MEIIPVVDEKNSVIGLKDMKIVHEKGILHRSASVILFNSKVEILLQQRSANKTICPLCWDLSVAEHVKPDESYLDAAKRGLKEELGISGIELTKLRGAHLQKTEYGALKDYEFAELYGAAFDGKIKMDKNEVKEAGFYLLKKVDELKKEGKLTPWFLDELKWLKKNKKLME